MIKKIALMALCIVPSLGSAQTHADMDMARVVSPSDSIQASSAAYLMAADSLHLPPIDYNGQVMPMSWPYFYSSAMGYPWAVHEGMNVSLGAFVTTAFGKNAPSGAGFGQNAALLYALPLSDRLSVAAGAYLNNLSWGGASWREAGLSAVVSYRFNSHWEAAVYGNKSLVNRYSSPLFRTNPAAWALPYSVGDRIGASLTYNFSPSMSVHLSVERVSMPTNRPFNPNQPSDRERLMP